MDIRNRLIKYLIYKNISKYKFYQKTGFSNGFLDKSGAIGSDKCEKICSEFPDINLEWLITGKEPMLKEQAEVPQQNTAADDDYNINSIYIDKITRQAEQIGELKNENKNLCKEISALQNDLECRKKEITELRDENSELRGIISSQFDSPEDMPELPEIPAQLVAARAEFRQNNKN
jgi:FtsZ-binding cell division protein ZapB